MNKSNKIIVAVAEHYEMYVSHLVGLKSDFKFAEGRQMLCYILRVDFKMRFKEIADLICQDHSTVHRNVKLVAQKIVTDKALRFDYDSIIENVGFR